MTIPTAKTGTARLLFNSAENMNLKPEWVTSGGVFVIQTPNGERFINRGVSSLNTPLGTSLVRNKYRTRLILDRHKLPNIPYLKTKLQSEALEFFNTHSAIIVKPNKGEGSKDIHIVKSATKLSVLELRGTIIEKYSPGKEMRYLVLDGRVIAVHESRYGDSVDQHRELERISIPKDLWDSELVAMSLSISKIFGLGFAAIDYMIGDHGTQILEINSSPGFKWFHAPTSGPSVDVARLFLDATLRAY